jgi:DNA-binding IscR family transcriptional regulator
MRISHRGLYALRALLHLAQSYEGGLVKNARVVVSQRGREGGYRLRRPPSEIVVGDVVRLMDGPLAPFGDAVELAQRVRTEKRHAGLFELFLDVRNAAAAILDHTSLQDLLERDRRLLQSRARGAGVLE